MNLFLNCLCVLMLDYVVKYLSCMCCLCIGMKIKSVMAIGCRLCVVGCQKQYEACHAKNACGRRWLLLMLCAGAFGARSIFV